MRLEFRELKYRTLWDVLNKPTDVAPGGVVSALGVRGVGEDLRGTLVALRGICEACEVLPTEVQDVLTASVGRLKELADVLVHQGVSVDVRGRGGDSGDVCVPVMQLVDDVVMSRAVVWQHREDVRLEHIFVAESHDLFIDRHIDDLRRSIAHILDNAVRFLTYGEVVAVRVARVHGEVGITIRDNGRGMLSDAQKKLFAPLDGRSVPPAALPGLAFAKRTMERLGGRIEVESSFGIGTTVRLTFPGAPTPPWFVPHITVPEQALIVVVDDDPAMHALWQLRFAGAPTGHSLLKHFTCAGEFGAWWRSLRPADRQRTLVLAEHDLRGRGGTGFDMVLQHSIQQHTVLLTHRGAEAEMQAGCRQHGVRMISKNMARDITLLNANHAVSQSERLAG